MGGQDKIRPLWRHHFSGIEGLIWVTDSNDRERIAEELHRVLNDDEMRDAVILVFANISKIYQMVQYYGEIVFMHDTCLLQLDHRHFDGV